MGNPLPLIDPDGREPNDRWKRTIHANGRSSLVHVNYDGGNAVDYVTTVDERIMPRVDAIKEETLSVQVVQNQSEIRQNNRYEPGLRYNGSPKNPALEGVDLSDFTPTKAGFSGGAKLGMALFFATTKKADDVVQAVVKRTIRSVVKQDNKLLKLAQETFKSNDLLRNEANSLIEQLSKGNMNPGIGTKHIGKNIFEARSKGGARVYFRQGTEMLEILGYSNKANQQQVIDRILEIH